MADNTRMDDPLKNMVNEALREQKDQMLQQFTQILQQLQVGNHASSSANQSFGAPTPFKVQVNFDIPIFEGKINSDAVENWLDQLTSYFSVNQFTDKEKITFSLLKSSLAVKNWWGVYKNGLERDELGITEEPTWNDFVDAIKEEYYPVGAYDDLYIQWQQLRQGKDQSVQDYTDKFHSLSARLGIQDTEQHRILKYCSGLQWSI